MNIPSPFHQGELQVQKLANETQIAQRNGGVISGKILPGAIPFVGQQNMLVLTSLDKQGNPWTSLLVGNPGFISAPDPSSLLLDISNILKYASDPLWENIKTNPQVGVLVIELATRRRLRVNGSIRAIDNNRFAITVEQTYPNCPKYIQRRNLKLTETAFNQPMPQPLSGSTLTAGQIKLIVYVIDPQGKVIYRHDWTVVEELADVLQHRDKLYPNEHAYTSELKVMNFRTNYELIKTVGRGGWNAIWDLVRGLPGFVIEHIKVDMFYRRQRSDDN